MTGLGFVEEKTRHALGREIVDDDIGRDIIDFNRKLQRKSRQLLPVQLWDMCKIATVRGSTNSAQLKCLKLGGVRTPHKIISLLLHGYRKHAL